MRYFGLCLLLFVSLLFFGCKFDDQHVDSVEKINKEIAVCKSVSKETVIQFSSNSMYVSGCE